MALQAIIFLLLGIVILILVAINGFLLWYFYKTNKKIDTLLEKGKIKDFKNIFLSQKEKNNDLEEQIKEAFLKIKNLDNISERTIQKVGVVRFNPFNDLGGNQSFVIALLDNQNNGFVISSLFIKEGNRVYAKFINAGKSDHLLSKEEMEAISHANAR
ncbi:MAG: hypothetical protein US35_C0030G0008 [Parcubacteria group bacterium GW2011_GWA2_37_10]|nr:MAG: hypothetical protein US35_C0030G0008 [Parcubacteria group bacterium GW2011_GWA2_37_10]